MGSMKLLHFYFDIPQKIYDVDLEVVLHFEINIFNNPSDFAGFLQRQKFFVIFIYFVIYSVIYSL